MLRTIAKSYLEHGNLTRGQYGEIPRPVPVEWNPEEGRWVPVDVDILEALREKERYTWGAFDSDWGYMAPWDAGDVVADSEVCPHPDWAVEEESFLVPCSQARCQLSGMPPGMEYHLGCGQHIREWCTICESTLYDSREQVEEDVVWVEETYMCSTCEAEGVQPGHPYCGVAFSVPRHKWELEYNSEEE